MDELSWNYIKENIRRTDDTKRPIFIWTGPVKELQRARRQLINHWRRATGDGPTDATIYRMHADRRCVDRGFLTTGPQKWQEDHAASGIAATKMLSAFDNPKTLKEYA